MDARAVATQLAYGRMALGAGLVVAPNLFAGAWAGRDSARGGGRVLAAALGARDVAIGAGTAKALANGEPVREWLLAGALADATDCLATLRARRELPVTGAVGVTALAAVGAVLSVWAAVRQPAP